MDFCWSNKWWFTKWENVMGECYGILWDRVLRSDGFTVIMGGIHSSCHCFCCFTNIFASLLLRAGLMIVVEFLHFFPDECRWWCWWFLPRVGESWCCFGRWVSGWLLYVVRLGKKIEKTSVLPKPYLSTWCRSELVDGSTGKHGEGYILRTPTRIVLKAGSLLCRLGNHGNHDGTWVDKTKVALRSTVSSCCPMAKRVNRRFR